jgi:hypothetical protein
MAVVSKVQWAEIKRLRRKLGITDKTKPGSHGPAKRMLEQLRGQLAEKLAETPDLMDSSSEASRRDDSGVCHCVVPKCLNTVSTGAKYCTSCAKKRKNGEIPSAVTIVYQDKTCKFCHDTFSPKGARAEFCKKECREAYKANGNHSIALDTPTPKLEQPHLCGLVGCETPTEKGVRKYKKYCCKDHSTTANKAYNAFRAGTITRDDLEGIVKNVYFRGEHRKQMELEPVDGIQRTPVEVFDGQVAFNVTMAICRGKAQEVYDSIIEKIQEACDRLEFDLAHTVPAPKMVCVLIDKMLNDADFAAVMEYNAETMEGDFLIGWNKEKSYPDCEYCQQRILTPVPSDNGEVKRFFTPGQPSEETVVN